MAKSPYDADLDRRPANFQPLTPLTLLERAASVFPDRTAIVLRLCDTTSCTSRESRSRSSARALASRSAARCRDSSARRCR